MHSLEAVHRAHGRWRELRPDYLSRLVHLDTDRIEYQPVEIDSHSGANSRKTIEEPKDRPRYCHNDDKAEGNKITVEKSKRSRRM